jgi:hypothetical protein
MLPAGLAAGDKKTSLEATVAWNSGRASGKQMHRYGAPIALRHDRPEMEPSLAGETLQRVKRAISHTLTDVSHTFTDASQTLPAASHTAADKAADIMALP